MKKNLYRKRVLGAQQPQRHNYIGVKEVLIPILAAVLSVLFNQVFYEHNKIVEENIRFKREILKEQMPTINRIQSFANRYAIATIENIRVIRYHAQIMDPKTKKLKDTVYYDQLDTVKFYVPAFATIESFRLKFIDDLNVVLSKRDLLDHRIYSCIEDLILFLDRNPDLDIRKPNAKMLEAWKNDTLQYKWNDLMEKLRQSCYTVLNYE